jgi:hypothetical protein
MLDGKARGDKLRMFFRPRAQESLAFLVYRRHRAKIDGASASVLGAVPVFATCPQLGNPRAKQMTFERPPLFLGRSRNRDSQHFLTPSANDGDDPWDIREEAASPGKTSPRFCIR